MTKSGRDSSNPLEKSKKTHLNRWNVSVSGIVHPSLPPTTSGQPMSTEPQQPSQPFFWATKRSTQA